MRSINPKLAAWCLLAVWFSAGCIAPPPTPSPTSLPPETVARIQAVVTRSPPQVYGTYPSPNQRWQAEVLIHPCVQVEEEQNGYEVLHLIEIGKQQPRLVDQQLQACGGLGAAGLAGLFWSPNSRYFYYTDGREGVPDGCGFWEQPLLRVDTHTGHSQRLGGGSRSPDGSKLVTWQGNEFIIWAVDGTAVGRQSLLVPNAPLGSYHWSPDSQALVYLQIAAHCPPSGPSTLVRFDLTTGQQALLLTQEQQILQIVGWREPTQIELVAEDNQQWRFDLATQQITRQ